MFVRVEEIKKRNSLFVIDENEKYIGELNEEDFYKCLIEDKEFKEDDYVFWYVDKVKLNKLLKR